MSDVKENNVYNLQSSISYLSIHSIIQQDRTMKLFPWRNPQSSEIMVSHHKSSFNLQRYSQPYLGIQVLVL